MRRMLQAGVLTLAALAVAGQPVRAVEEAEVQKAIDRGVAALRALQKEDGTWEHSFRMGATSLAGLTLLECGAKPDDPAVQAAATAVRRKALSEDHTYSLSLMIVFLDRLDDPADVPLLELMAVRLLAGQNAEGGWNYNCRSTDAAQLRWATDAQKNRAELVGRRELPKRPARGKRTVRDLSKETQAALTRMGAGMERPGGAVPLVSDLSNTQFAVLGIWAARRHGLPVGPALVRLDRILRVAQHPDGGWGYVLSASPALRSSSTPTMACAGVLGLAVSNGLAAELRGPRGRPRDVSRDASLQKALTALGSCIDHPLARRPKGARLERIGGKAYYFLWSLERIAVALGLETLGKKDWYAWGAEVILANQNPDGSWRGEFADSGADTCFALLFLRRANLMPDLTATLRGKLKDPGEAVLRGGVGPAAFGGGKAFKSKPALDPAGKPGDKPSSAGGTPPGGKSPPRDAGVARLVDELVAAPPERQGPLLEQLRDNKGSQNTEALAAVIPRLRDEAQARAREALTDRLTRMKAATLAEYLVDEDAEIRAAAALACAAKNKADAAKVVPGLIRQLADPGARVRGAAHKALKALSGRDFGPEEGATRAERARAIASWEAWWNREKRK